MFQCKICGRKFKNLNGLMTHVGIVYGIKKYYDKFYKKQDEGVCKECGKRTKFYKFSKGYSRFCSTKCLNSNKGVQKKKEQTCFKNNKVNHPAQSKKIRDKINQTNLAKYGVKHSFLNKKVREASIRTNLIRYNVKHPMQCKMVANKVTQNRFIHSTLPHIKRIKKEMVAEGYKRLVYKKSIMYFTCPNNHRYCMRIDYWDRGQRCGKCWRHLTGKDSPTWKGGISNSPYPTMWNKKLRLSIRNRDDNKCQNPLCFSGAPTDLTIHHIDYNKQNCDESNLITVCRSCNSKANTDRGWHKAFYQEIMRRKSDKQKRKGF